MVEDDTFTYSVKQPSPVQVNTDRINTTAYTLITKERAQKLDLLIHLLSNLSQGLVVCGPEGIGKTTLLTMLQERKTESWRYCLIQGNADLSFETMRQQLASANKPVLEGAYKHLVLIIDDAGKLVPGLVMAIIQYAAANSGLRVVFALTHDELQVKRGSDRAVDDCHIVEILPLSEKQCGDFLQHLSIKPALNLSFKAISETMIAHVYRETHGIPGRIIAYVSGLPEPKQGGKWKWLLAGFVAIAVALGVMWLAQSKKIIAPTAIEQPVKQQENSQKETLMPTVKVNTPGNDQPAFTPLATPEAHSSIDMTDALPSSEQSNAASAIMGPSAQSMPPEKPKQSVGALLDTIVKEQVTTEVAPTLDIKEPVNAVDRKPSVPRQQTIVQPVAAMRKALKPAKLKETVRSPESFLSENPNNIQIPQKPVAIAAAPRQVESEAPSAPTKNNVTLQLIVLSKQASVDGLLNKYPMLAGGGKAIKTVANGQERFIVVYGSYPDVASAHKARQSLPSEFHDALARKITSLEHR